MAYLFLVNREVSEEMQSVFGDRSGVEVQLHCDDGSIVGLAYLRNVSIGKAETALNHLTIGLDRLDEPKRVGGDVISCP